MTDAEYVALRAKHRAEMAAPKRCGQCQCAYKLVPSGYATYRQVPAWSPPEELPVSVCFRCCPPDWGGARSSWSASAEVLDEEDEKWDAEMREIEERASQLEADEYRDGKYTDDMSPTERRIR